MTKRSGAGMILVAAALILLSSCGGHRPYYTFTRHGAVSLTGSVTVRGTFSYTEFAGINAMEPKGCEASVHPVKPRELPGYPAIGDGQHMTVGGRAFMLDIGLRARDGAGTYADVVRVTVGDVEYVDRSGTVTLAANGDGVVTIHQALALDADPGGPAVTGTVLWSCRDGAVTAK